MWFIGGSVALAVILVVLGKRIFRAKHACTAGVMFLTCVSALSSICLSQNYILSVTPGYHDGIGISNPIAYWIIGEGVWTPGRFEQYFTNAITITLFLLLLSSAFYLWESRLANMKK